MDGWIKVHRKILDNPIIEKPLWCWLWVYLLLKANHKDNKFIFNGKDITIKRGQLLTGRKTIHKETKIGEQVIRSGLTYLKSTSQITINSTNKYSIITICKYNAYQELTSKLTNQQPASNQQATTNNNVKNDKNVKNINMSITPQFLEDMKIKFTNLDIEGEYEKMKDYLSSTGKKYKDYQAFFRNWLRRSKPSRMETYKL